MSEDRLKQLVRELNEASEAYYNGTDEIMSNEEWDRKFKELEDLEKRSGIVLPDSPTHTTGAEVRDGKVKHEFPALSLDKSKDPEALKKWAGGRPVWLSWKLDGLTLVATYDGGNLTRLVTRGDGHFGKDITFHVPAIGGVPLHIRYTGHLVVRGEAVISYADFKRVNEKLLEEEKYKNPRNLASGTLGLDADRTDEVLYRGVHMIAFAMVHADEDDGKLNPQIRFDPTSYGHRMDILDILGFDTVPRELIQNADDIPDAIRRWTERVPSFKYPVDGLVIVYDDNVYAQSGSVTGHHATNAGFAFKWQDEKKETTIRSIEWSCGTRDITPVAVFDPVELEGTTVSRASCHNVSYIEGLDLGIGDRVTVYKANMIIPQIGENLTRSGCVSAPDRCPACGAPTKISVSGSGAKSLVCTNDQCPAKQIKKFMRFAEDDGMGLKGISEATFAQLIDHGLIRTFADIYRLKDHRAEISGIEGFGVVSVTKMLETIDMHRVCDPVHYIYALCIPLWGRDATKRACAAIGSEEMFRRFGNGESFDDIDGIGPEKTAAVLKWWADPVNRQIRDELSKEIVIAHVRPSSDTGKCAGKTFVITGDVHSFANRAAFTAYVEKEGGKVSGSVSKNTDYLVNNDSTSSSSKNQKAKALGIPIITEDEFVRVFG